MDQLFKDAKAEEIQSYVFSNVILMSHCHRHTPPDTADGHGRAFALSIGLNAAIIVIQAIYGWIANSTALLADATHNLSDMLGLLFAWGAIWLAKKQPSAHYTFGLRSSSILAALINAALLLFASGAIIGEAIKRFVSPTPIAGVTVFVIAMAGAVINGFSAWLFMTGSKHDLNIRGAFLHMMSDTAISLTVALSGLIILATEWRWLDPAMSIIIVAVIVYGTWGLLRDSVRLALDAVPANIDLKGIVRYLEGLPGVADIHDLHIWGLSTTENSMTVHLVMPRGHPGDAFLDEVVRTLERDYRVHHATIQVDLGASLHHCALQHDSLQHNSIDN